MFRLLAALALLASPASLPALPAPAQALLPPPAEPVRSPEDLRAATDRALAALPPDQAAMKAHVLFLADDALKGREAGSAEYEIAARYVAAQFYAQGLRPAGDEGSYLQRVPLMRYRAADQGSLVRSAGGDVTTLTFGKDYVPGADPAGATTIAHAPVVFVGYGIVAPQFDRDDYAGADVRGRIVAFLDGAPQRYPGEERAHFASDPTKAKLAQDRGAIGYLKISTGDAGSFAKLAGVWDRTRVTWVEESGRGHQLAPRTPELGTLSRTGAAKLFAGARLPWTEIEKLMARDDARFRALALPGTLAVALRTSREPFASSNVAGLLPGSDPRLKDEVVVLSAHLDHVGVGEPVNGDAIYNGAEDNAVGIASLIEEARHFRESGRPPRRSVLFLAVTAEEVGLVGSDYFAHHPGLPRPMTMVADVKLDMPILTYRFEDMIAFGADRSTLGPIVRQAVAALGVGFSPDPQPEQGLFVRSDHYRFVQQGVPSVFLWPGHKGPGAAATAAFFAQHYHKPSDEVSLPIDWAQGVRFVEANYAIARGIADGDERPRWNKADFFGTLYGGLGAR